MRGFNFLNCIWENIFWPVSSWDHLLFEIKFDCCVLFIRYWKIESKYTSVLVPTYHLQLAFVVYSWWIVVFIDNLRTGNEEYANSTLYVSHQRGRRQVPYLMFQYQCCLLVFREICTHAVSPGTSWDGARGHSFCCDLGSLLSKTITFFKEIILA